MSDVGFRFSFPDPHTSQGHHHTDPWSPAGTVFETVPRRLMTAADLGSLSTGTLLLFGGAALDIGQTVTTLSFWSGGTALGTGTAQWFAVYDSTLHKLCVTADDGSTAWAGNTVKTLYVSRSVTDASITSGAAVVNSATAAFTSTDVGKRVTFMGAGAAGVPLGTSAAAVTIASVQSATQATLNTNAGTSVASAGTLYVATPYTPTTSGGVYVGINVTATTMPTLRSVNMNNAAMSNVAPILAGSSSNSLTGATSAPATAAALTATTALAYAYAT